LSSQNNSFIELQPIQFPLVNHFYKRIYKKGIAHKNERVFVVKENDIICAGKLKQLDGHLLLTGIACDPAYRKQGHASQLIKSIQSLQQQPLYCFPYLHLHNFYSKLGFAQASPDTLPKVIHQRFTAYSKNRALLLMVYHG